MENTHYFTSYFVISILFYIFVYNFETPSTFLCVVFKTCTRVGDCRLYDECVVAVLLPRAYGSSERVNTRSLPIASASGTIVQRN